MTIPLGPYLHTNRAPRFRTSGALRAEIDARSNVALERVPVTGSAFVFGRILDLVGIPI
jgi:hypothetical protein